MKLKTPHSPCNSKRQKYQKYTQIVSTIQHTQTMSNKKQDESDKTLQTHTNTETLIKNVTAVMAPRITSQFQKIPTSAMTPKPNVLYLIIFQITVCQT